MSKFYAGLLVIASQLAMAALGMLILVVIMDVIHSAVSSNQYYGINR